ncbi:serine hydrolase [Ulvibacterium marinum]|uniref:Serine hydrolase n=1 Tax=Ulvibacterium marinum TaxID=2419782 RepID=A0A3B0BRN7_9FLAO|nr:serine hydrolase [Ulvibacterium marinum]RKN75953.1 serine hydrolase [Ulvibacterium marinum]
MDFLGTDRSLLLSIFSFFIFIAVSGQSKKDKIDELMKAYHELDQFNGAVLVAQNGEIIFKEGFGLANMEWEVPNSSETKFLLASVSKQFTAMLILKLVNEGSIKLEGRISDYLDYYPKPVGREISVHQLLNHTSGIPDITNFPDFDSAYAHKQFTTKELLGTFQSLELDFRPGSKFGYSNTGYSVLAAIIEKVTGTSYAMALKTLLGPLGMKDTGYASSKTVVKDYASGYRWAPLDGYINPIYFDNSISLGSGGIYSTLDDLYKWDQALYTDELVADSLMRKMRTPYKNEYGYGFWIWEWENPNTKELLTFMEHGGSNVGFNTLIFRSIDDKNLIILLTNTNEAKLGFIRNRIRSILYDRPYDLPELEVKNMVADVLRQKGIDAAREKFLELKETKLDEYGEREFIYEFSKLGYGLVLSDHMEEAIEIYKLNVEAFPNSAKVFDDLGEAYMLNGNKELAIEHYGKSLELDKGNKRVKRMLEKLRGN